MLGITNVPPVVLSQVDIVKITMNRMMKIIMKINMKTTMKMRMIMKLMMKIIMNITMKMMMKMTMMTSIKVLMIMVVIVTDWDRDAKNDLSSIDAKLAPAQKYYTNISRGITDPGCCLFNLSYISS